MLLRVRTRYFMSAVPARKVAHELDQHIDAFGRHGVVEAGAHATDRAVAFQVNEPRFAGGRNEALVELRPGKRKWHVHPGAARPRHRIAIEIRLIDGPIELVRLRAVPLPHAYHAAL